MNHAELSKQLAIALGYYPESVTILTDLNTQYAYVYREGCSQGGGLWWWRFDYRDPSVALAMVELAMKEGADIGEYGCGFKVYSTDGEIHAIAPTLHEAAARAVIALKGMK